MRGKVGPFFYISGKIYADSIEHEKAEKYGEFKTWGNHSEFWDALSEKDVRLQQIEYFSFPRGRVTYNFIKEKFYIYLNPKIKTESIIEEIVKEFDLDGLDFNIDDTDEHYQL